jgi:CRP-like cAMP-binding protein
MSYLIHPTLNESDSRSNPKLLRIFLDKDFTRLDFGYATHSYYIKGGWFNIYPQTHLRVHGINEPFPLTHAQIGSAIGSTRVTVTRLMGKLRQRGLILTQGDNLICLPAESINRVS